MATVAQIYYPKYIHLAIWENVASITGTIIIVQTYIHHHSKVFTTGQARMNHEYYVIKCMGGQYALHYSYHIFALAVCCS